MIGLMFAAAVQISPSSGGCYPNDSAALTRLVTDVEAAASRDVYAQIESKGRLANYWGGLCISDRINLSKKDVEQIAGLLRYNSTHFTVPNMLMDVEKNLRFASRAIDAALKSQKVLDNRPGPLYPLMSSGGYQAQYSLKCLQIKIRYGYRSKKYCRYIRYLDANQDGSGRESR